MLKESGNPLKNIPQVREGGTDTQVSHILTPLVKTPNQNLGPVVRYSCWLLAGVLQAVVSEGVFLTFP